MRVIVNPGTGPVRDASLTNAEINMATLIKDAGVSDAISVHDARYDETGRFFFDVNLDGRSVEVLMPGLPLERVRWLDEPGQNIWHFPRLYVGGSSWVWKYAVDMLQDHLTRKEDEELEASEK